MRKLLFRFSLLLPVMVLIISIIFFCIKGYDLVKKALASQEETIVRELTLHEQQKIFLYENLGDGKAFWELYDVINCESGWNQELKHINYHKKGNKCFPTSTDWGTGMINDCYWDEDAKAMGLDYKNNVYDNLFMITYIYKVYGITQWVCYGNGYK